MHTTQKYSAGAISESFWFVEFKKIVQLCHQGKTWEEIQIICLAENMLGISNEYRAKRVYGYLKSRVSVLSPEIIALFVTADVATQKIIALYAIAKQNRLLSEFLFEVYREKILLGAQILQDSDINVFFHGKQTQSEVIESWSDTTLKKLRRLYFNFLTDAGLITVLDKQKTLTPAVLDSSLEFQLKQEGEQSFLKAITGVV